MPPKEGTIAAWNYPPTAFAATEVAANSGALMAGAKIEFAYASGAKGNLGHASRAAINVPNNAGGWFPGTQAAPDAITAESSGGWIITLSTTGYEDIVFSADQSSSNNGPRDFKLAYRIGTTGTWTVFDGDGEVTVLGDSGDMGQTFNNVALPTAVNDQALVQIKVWVATNARRSDGGTTSPDSLDPAGGNTSINKVVFVGEEL